MIRTIAIAEAMVHSPDHSKTEPFQNWIIPILIIKIFGFRMGSVYKCLVLFEPPMYCIFKKVQAKVLTWRNGWKSINDGLLHVTFNRLKHRCVGDGTKGPEMKNKNKFLYNSFFYVWLLDDSGDQKSECVRISNGQPCLVFEWVRILNGRISIVRISNGRDNSIANSCGSRWLIAIVWMLIVDWQLMIVDLNNHAFLQHRRSAMLK